MPDDSKVSMQTDTSEATSVKKAKIGNIPNLERLFSFQIV
jgi:hypothetical protein